MDVVAQFLNNQFDTKIKYKNQGLNVEQCGVLSVVCIDDIIAGELHIQRGCIRLIHMAPQCTQGKTVLDLETLKLTIYLLSKSNWEGLQYNMFSEGASKSLCAHLVLL